MYAEQIPENIRDLKIDLGKHLIWVGLISLGQVNDYSVRVDATNDETFIKYAESLREEQPGTFRLLAAAAQRALDTANAPPRQSMFMSINKDIVENVEGIGDALSNHRSYYFHQLIRAAAFNAADLKKVLEMIVEYGQDT